MNTSPRFYELLQRRLNDNVNKLIVSDPLTPEQMRLIRNTIMGTIDGIFRKSTYKLSANGVTWLTDRYFKAIRINESQLMSDEVVINEYALVDLPLTDIMLLNDLYRGTSLDGELSAEVALRKRTMS